MHRIVCCPGVVAVERSTGFQRLRWEPASVWLPFGFAIDDWKSQCHLVEQASLDRSTKDALSLFLPEEEIAPRRRLDRQMARATRLVIVPDALRDELLLRGLRVWTVGFHRNPSLLRLVGEGGPAPTVWIEQGLYELYDGVQTMPSGRPATVPWYGAVSDPDRIDRVLRAASGGVLDEPSVLLAAELDRSGWGNLRAPEPERRSRMEMIRMIDADPVEAVEICIDDLRWAPDWQRRWKDDEDLHGTDALRAAVAALASASGPPKVEVAGVGVFHRESLPPVTVSVSPPEPHDGWLPAVSRGSPGGPGELRLEAYHRYVQHLG